MTIEELRESLSIINQWTEGPGDELILGKISQAISELEAAREVVRWANDFLNDSHLIGKLTDEIIYCLEGSGPELRDALQNYKEKIK